MGPAASNRDNKAWRLFKEIFQARFFRGLCTAKSISLSFCDEVSPPIYFAFVIVLLTRRRSQRARHQSSSHVPTQFRFCFSSNPPPPKPINLSHIPHIRQPPNPLPLKLHPLHIPLRLKRTLEPRPISRHINSSPPLLSPSEFLPLPVLPIHFLPFPLIPLILRANIWRLIFQHLNHKAILHIYRTLQHRNGVLVMPVENLSIAPPFRQLTDKQVQFRELREDLAQCGFRGVGGKDRSGDLWLSALVILISGGGKIRGCGGVGVIRGGSGGFCWDGGVVEQGEDVAVVGHGVQRQGEECEETVGFGFLFSGKEGGDEVCDVVDNYYLDARILFGFIL